MASAEMGCFTLVMELNFLECLVLHGVPLWGSHLKRNLVAGHELTTKLDSQFPSLFCGFFIYRVGPFGIRASLGCIYFRVSN
ncbi:MAG: hypothetical protein CMD87_04875 [Gammaproteobacteria bacterium]|nr:hypothetical protein [Gammaproteobacteria bacterium]